MTPALRRLANLYGVQTGYYDFFKKRTDASGDSVLEAVRLLGAPVRRIEDARDAVRARTLELWARVLEPVVVVQPHRPSSVEIRVPAAQAAERVRCSVKLEDGTERAWVCDLHHAGSSQSKEVEGIRYLGKRVRLPSALPPGYHELTVEGIGEAARCRVIAAPTRAFSSKGRRWGAFLPLYALHSSESWGAGDVSDLERLQHWIGELGGDLVSILPVLAVHPQTPFDPSPYAPSSRLFWNELYVDPRRAPELAACPGAQRLLASAAFARELAALRAVPEVDYGRQRALRRGVLEELARWLAASQNGRYGELQQYVRAHRSLTDYAAFAAAQERRQAPWPQWPEPLRGGAVGRADRDEDAFFYHLYVQWLAEQQLAGIASVEDRKPGLYLDLPLGVHADGYDTWRYRDVFALDACGGAPPDAVFTRGQNWQFPPLHPEGIRAQGYHYLIECLRHQLRHASSLRIDHVMGLHRLYWVPKGWPASDGVYVQYRSEELYAILCLESHRHRATIVGENLGTVPANVNASLERHGILKMYVVQYEAQPAATRPLKPVPPDTVASLNTHDMPPFVAYLRGMDLEDRLELGLLPKAELARERRTRRGFRLALARFLHRQGYLSALSDDESSLVEGTLRWLAASPAALVLINLEDLWLETAPQNLPGTGIERPNWRRKARCSLEQLAARPAFVDTLRRVADARTRRRAPR